MTDLPQSTVEAMAVAWFETSVMSSSVHAAEHMLRVALDKGEVVLAAEHLADFVVHENELHKLQQKYDDLREAAQVYLDQGCCTDPRAPGAEEKLRQALYRELER